jgi:hypothetical protein
MTMMMRLVISVALLAGLSRPAWSDSTNRFQDFFARVIAFKQYQQ